MESARRAGCDKVIAGPPGGSTRRVAGGRSTAATVYLGAQAILSYTRISGAAHVAASVAAVRLRAPSSPARSPSSPALSPAFCFAASPAVAAPFVFIDPGHGGIYNHTHYGRLTEKHANLLDQPRSCAGSCSATASASGMTRKTDTRRQHRRHPHVALQLEHRPLELRQGRPQVRRPAARRPAGALQRRRTPRAPTSSCRSTTTPPAAARRPNGDGDLRVPRDRLGIVAFEVRAEAVVGSAPAYATAARCGPDFYVLRWSNMPAILVEGAFMTNRSDGRCSRGRGSARGSRAGSPRDRALARDESVQAVPAQVRRRYSRRHRGRRLPGRVAGRSGTVLLASPEAVRNELACVALARKYSAPLLFVDASGRADVPRPGNSHAFVRSRSSCCTGLGEPFAATGRDRRRDRARGGAHHRRERRIRGIGVRSRARPPLPHGRSRAWCRTRRRRRS